MANSSLHNLAVRLHSGHASNADIGKAVQIIEMLSVVDTSLVHNIRIFETQNKSWWCGSIEPDCKKFNKNLVCGDGCGAIQLCSLRSKKRNTSIRRKFWKNLVGSYNVISKAQEIAAGHAGH